jgi:hypothetical protein
MAARIDSASNKSCAAGNRERSRWDATAAAGSRQRISPVDRSAGRSVGGPIGRRRACEKSPGTEMSGARQLRSGIGSPAGTKCSETEFRQ